MSASLQRAAIGHREEALSGSYGIRTLPARINHQNQYIWDPGHETSRLMSKLLFFCAHVSYLAAQLEHQFQKTESLFPGRGRGVGGGWENWVQPSHTLIRLIRIIPPALDR